VPKILMLVTTSLEQAGFTAQGTTVGEKQHRWAEREGPGIIDVLIPENLGRAADYLAQADSRVYLHPAPNTHWTARNVSPSRSEPRPGRSVAPPCSGRRSRRRRRTR
jgi:hypothetical protein